MAVAQFVLGVALIVVAAVCLFGRERIVARAKLRSPGRQVQPPVAFLVMGVLLALTGVGQVVLAVR